MHILLAVDDSPPSLDARDLVAALTWPEGTTISLVSAFEVPTAWFADTAMAGGWLDSAEDTLRQQAREALAAMAAPLENRGWTIEQRVAQGRAATVIMSAAEEVRADLIVLGSRGRGPIQSMLLGSVSAEVAAQARQSVLVARGKRASRVLVATDGSECASIVPDILADWGALRGLEAVALTVTPVDSPAFGLLMTLYTLGDEPLEGQREEVLARHREVAAQMARRLSEIGIPSKAEVRSGDAAHEIISAASERRVDLIVTGSRCLHGVDRWLLGSVARNVLVHADASVLIVRPKEAVPPS